MALSFQSSFHLKRSLPSYHLLPTSTFIFPTKSKFTLRAIDSSSSSQDPKPTNGDTSTVLTPPQNTTNKTAVGFGPSSSSSSSSSSVETKDKKKKQKGRERASVIRRPPLQKPSPSSNKKETQTQEQGSVESAFLLTWFGLGSVIIIEGLALSASGFLPEEWDKFLVKYLYPVFTPTVFFFVAGTVVYGVLKYFEGEKTKG